MNRRDLEEWELLLGFSVPRASEEYGSYKIARQRGWMPRIDMLEAADHLLIRVELAGVPADHVSLNYNADRNTLLIRGERPDELGRLATRYQPHLLEIEEGMFGREIVLPDAELDLNAVKTQLRNGILIITLPKRAKTSQVIIVEQVKVTEF